MTRTLAAVIALTAFAAPALADEAQPPAAPVMRKPQPQPQGAPSRPDPLGGGASSGYAIRPPMPPVPTPKPKPTPTAEVTQMAKDLAGTWTCKGNSMRPDGLSTPFAATVTAKLELDGTWFTMALVEKGGPMKWTAYRNYDTTAKSWNELKMANSGGRIISSSAGEQGGKWTWNGTAQSANGAAATRDYEQREGKSLKVWGEAMAGGAWAKMYEATCKR